MFKTLVLQASYNLSDERTEYLIRDRLSFMRFLGLGLADTVPDANTIWTFREALTRARIAGKPAIEALFERFDAALSTSGFLAMSGQIIDASIVAAPKQHNTDGEKRDIKDGRIPPQWPDGTYSVQGAATALSISPQTVFKWLQKGRLSGRQLAKGMPWQITLSSSQIAELRTQVRRTNQSKK